MPLLLLSFLAGVLTILAPCILPLLPVIVGGSLVNGEERRNRPYVITVGLVISVVAFSLLLKATATLLSVPQQTWQIVSGVLILAFGVHMLAPSLWEAVTTKFNLQSRATHALPTNQKGYWGDFLLGAALGPVFNSCSPTYALIIAVILPVSFGLGMLYLTAYAVGLGVTLLTLTFLGRAAIRKLGWAANPSGWFRKLIGVLFLIVGFAIIFGLDKRVQAYVLERGWYDPVAEIEQRF